MKQKLMYGLALFVILALMALNNSPSEGPHGGIVKSSGDYNIEMKNDPDTSFSAYLLDKKLKTINNKGISGEVKFFLPDSTAMDVVLKPAVGNSFIAKAAPGFYACKITFHVSGKDISASFEKQSQIVQQK